MTNEFEYKIHISIDEKGLSSDVKSELAKVAKEISNNKIKLEFTGDYKDLFKQMQDLQKKYPEIDLTKGIEFHLSDKVKEDTEIGQRLMQEFANMVTNSLKDIITSINGIETAISNSEERLNELEKRRSELHDGKEISDAVKAYENAEKRLSDAHAKFIKDGAQNKTRAKALEEMRRAVQDMKNLENETGKKVENNATIKILSDTAKHEYEIAKDKKIKIGELQKELLNINPTHNSYFEMLGEIDAQIMEEKNKLSSLKKDLETANNPQLKVNGKLADNFLDDLQSQLNALTGLEVKVKPVVDKDVKLEVLTNTQTTTSTPQNTGQLKEEAQAAEEDAKKQRELIKAKQDSVRSQEEIRGEFEKTRSEVAQTVSSQEQYFENLYTKAQSVKLTYEEIIAVVNEAEKIASQYSKHQLQLKEDDYSSYDGKWEKYNINFKGTKSDVGNLQKALQDTYKLYKNIESAIKNTEGIYKGEHYNTQDLEELRGIFGSIATYSDSLGVDIEDVINKIPRMTKEFKSLAVDAVNQYREIEANNKQYNEEDEILKKNNAQLSRRYSLLEKIVTISLGDDIRKQLDVENALGTGVLGDIEFSDKGFQYGDVFNAVNKLCSILGIEIPNAAHDAKGAIAEVSEAVSTPPNTSGMDKVEEELHEEASAAAEAEQRVAEFAGQDKLQESLAIIRKAFNSMDTKQTTSNGLFDWIKNNCSEAEQSLFHTSEGIEEFKKVIRGLAFNSNNAISISESLGLDTINFNELSSKEKELESFIDSVEQLMGSKWFAKGEKTDLGQLYSKLFIDVKTGAKDAQLALAEFNAEKDRLNQNNLSSESTISQENQLMLQGEKIRNSLYRCNEEIGMSEDDFINKLQKENEEIQNGNRIFQERMAFIKDGKVVKSFFGDEAFMSLNKWDIETEYDKAIHTHSPIRGSGIPSYEDIELSLDASEDKVNEFVLYWNNTMTKIQFPSGASAAESFLQDYKNTLDAIITLTNDPKIATQYGQAYLSQILEEQGIDFSILDSNGNTLNTQRINDSDLKVINDTKHDIANINLLGNIDEQYNEISKKGRTLSGVFLDLSNKSEDFAVSGETLFNVLKSLNEQLNIGNRDNTYESLRRTLPTLKPAEIKDILFQDEGFYDSLDDEDALKSLGQKIYAKYYQTSNQTPVLFTDSSGQLSALEQETKAKQDNKKATDELAQSEKGLADAQKEVEQQSNSTGVIKQTTSQLEAEFEAREKNNSAARELVEIESAIKNKPSNKNIPVVEQETKAKQDDANATKELTEAEKELNAVKESGFNRKFTKASIDIKNIQEDIRKLGTTKFDEQIKGLVSELNNVGESNTKLDALINKIATLQIQIKQASDEAKALANNQENAFNSLISNINKKSELQLKNKNLAIDGKTDSSEYVGNQIRIEELEKEINAVDRLQFSEKQLKAIEEAEIKAKNDLTKAEETEQKAIDNTRLSIEKKVATLKENGKFMKVYGGQVDNLLKEAQGSNVTLERLRAIRNELDQLATTAKLAGDSGRSFGQILKQRFTSLGAYLGSFASFYRIVGYVKQSFNTIRELDTALVDLRKTTKMSNSELNEFYKSSNDVAKQLGVTTAEVINQAAAWSRLGYSSREAATEMSKISSKFASISPGVTVDQSTDYLVSTMQAYGIAVDDVERKILDNVNAVGNAFATTNGEIGEMLTRSSAAMKAANNSLEQTIALESAAVQITRNAETTGTAFRTENCPYVQQCA